MFINNFNGHKNKVKIKQIYNKNSKSSDNYFIEIIIGVIIVIIGAFMTKLIFGG